MNEFLRAAQSMADWEEDVTRIMMVFPAQTDYHARPTSEQMEAFVREALSGTAHSARGLYEILARGEIPPEVDAIAREHAKHWPPVGEIVEAYCNKLIEPRAIDPFESMSHMKGTGQFAVDKIEAASVPDHPPDNVRYPNEQSLTVYLSPALHQRYREAGMITPDGQLDLGPLWGKRPTLINKPLPKLKRRKKRKRGAQ